MPDAIKFVDAAKTLIEGYGMPFGGPFKGRDFDGESFTANTDFCFDWFSSRPTLYDHGLDGTTKTTVVGREVGHELKDMGVWTQVQLDRNSAYYEAVGQLIDEGKMGFSSGAMWHLVEKDGPEIKRWPWVELSITPTPSNPFANVAYAVKSAEALAHMRDIGIQPPQVVEDALKALDDWSDTNGLGMGRFAERLNLALEEVKALVTHAEQRNALRAGEGRKSGRRLSAATRSQMAAFRELLSSLDKDISALIEESEPESKKSTGVYVDWLVAEARTLGVEI